MQEFEGRSDVHVFTGPDVPKVFEDAYAVNVDGTLKIWRWSTRQQAKRHPVAEYAPGMWMSYHHLGEQGDEVVEPQQRAAQPRRARPSQDVVDHAEAPKAAWTPESPAEREAEIRSREPGAPENLQPAVVRPSLPPKDFPVPTHQLPRRVPAPRSRPRYCRRSGTRSRSSPPAARRCGGARVEAGPAAPVPGSSSRSPLSAC